MIKPVFLITVALLVMTAPCPAFAYRLPACGVSDEERVKPAEDVLLAYRAEMDALSKSVNIARIDEHRRNPKIRLAAKERKAAKTYDTLIVKTRFWEDVVGLKDSLAALHGTNPPAEAVTEADAIGKNVIETLYALSQKWKVGSALFTNFLINLGLKEKGFCYHYVTRLRQSLLNRAWNRFDIRWGTAWKFSFRESNALVITAKGRSFDEGLVIDPWRTAGRPFWTPVKGDRFPWVEEVGVEEKYEVN